ncbi:MAG: chemotaxis protein CheD [Planctomycetes bacterium]|nr:chemotaxis protein CheD [Planctomycetota bacterium]
MGEITVARNGGVLRTLLGSCIGLALYDRPTQVGGLAHIVLPKSRGKDEPPGKFVDTCIPALLSEMKTLAGRPITPQARIAGGANMFATKVTDTVGRQNIEACERLLAELRIPLESRHCGGEKGRRMMLDTTTGTVTIEIVGADPIKL